MEIASLMLAIITLIFALFIHSETREALSRINIMLDTLPGAHDVHRLIDDIEKTKQRRGRIICDKPKNTHISYAMPFTDIPLGIRIRNNFWRFIKRLAGYLSGDIYESIVEPSDKQ